MRRLTSRTSFRKRHERSNSLLRRLRVDRYRFSMSNDYFVALRGLKPSLRPYRRSASPGSSQLNGRRFFRKGRSSGLRASNAVDSKYFVVTRSPTLICLKFFTFGPTLSSTTLPRGPLGATVVVAWP